MTEYGCAWLVAAVLIAGTLLCVVAVHLAAEKASQSGASDE